MDPFCVHFDKTLVQLAWQFEGGECPLTYLISCTVFLAPYALQLANSRLDLKSLEDTVKLGVYSPTSITGHRTTGAPAQEIHGNCIIVTCVVHILLLFTHFFPEHVEYTSANDSLYDEPSYKHVISEEGKKELINIKYTKDLNTTTCPILQMQFNEGDEIIKLPCDHCFEPTAINTWLQNEKAECPVCRYKLKHVEKKITQNA